MTCPTCGKTFQPKTKRQKYCSRHCERQATAERYANRDEPPVPINATPIDEFICKNCGKTVFIYSRTDQRSSYCCGKCAVKYRNKLSLEQNIKKRGDNLGMSSGMSLQSLIRRERRGLD